MSLLKTLMEMDPYMRPIGGPVCPPNTPIQSTTPQPDCVVPDRRYNTLLNTLINRTAAEEEEIVADERYEDDLNDGFRSEVVNFIRGCDTPSMGELQRTASNLGISMEDLCCEIIQIAKDSLPEEDPVEDTEFDQEIDQTDDDMEEMPDYEERV